MILPKLRDAIAKACLQRGPRCKTFHAIAMEGTGAGPIAAGRTRDSDVPELAMRKSACWLAADDQAHANAGTHRDVSEIVETPSASPAHFCQGSSVDIGVERGRNSGGASQNRWPLLGFSEIST